jgi:hypothetical protein
MQSKPESCFAIACDFARLTKCSCVAFARWNIRSFAKYIDGRSIWFVFPQVFFDTLHQHTATISAPVL